MSEDDHWDEELREILSGSGPRTRRRSIRVITGTAGEGRPAWQRQEIRGIDDNGNVHVVEVTSAARAVCGCLLAQNSPQAVCASCHGVVCREHAVQCRHCRQWFCQDRGCSSTYGKGEGAVSYCRRHRRLHYLKLLLGVRE